MKPKNNAYSIVDVNKTVLCSFYAEDDSSAYVEAHLRCVQLGKTLDVDSWLAVHWTTVLIDCPYDKDDSESLALAARFSAAIGGFRAFRAMRMLATDMIVCGKSGMRCVHIRRLVASGYTVQSPFGKRRIMHVTGDFFFEKDLTKTALDFAEWLAVNP